MRSGELVSAISLRKARALVIGMPGTSPGMTVASGDLDHSHGDNSVPPRQGCAALLEGFFRVANSQTGTAMLRWFYALMPKEERFFELFARHSDVVVAGAKALREMLEGGEAVERHYQAVMDREQDADNITREVLIAVRRTFITPFDRGDIKDLITSMDNTIDQMQKTAKTIMLFEQRTFTPQQKEMADAIVKAAVLVQEAIPLLSSINSNSGRISRISEQISQIEGQTDDLHDAGLQ